MVPKALAFDLDGTLLAPSGEVSERNFRALVRAREAGLELILATARWYRLALPVAESFDLSGPLIACQGAEVRRIRDGIDLLDQRLPRDFAGELFALCDERRCLAWIPFGEEVLMKAEGTIPDLPPGTRQVDALSDEAAGVPRMALIQGSAICAAIQRELAPRWRDQVTFAESISSRGKVVLTLTAAEVSKGVALATACRDLGVGPEEVVAVGDAENDIEMFRVAGYSFAMGQAEPEVRSAARAVTGTCEEDGVAQAVEDLLEKGLP